MLLNNKDLRVEIDEITGYTKLIQSNEDEFEMNWILKNSDFGKVDGFAVKRCVTDINGVEIFAENKQDIALAIKKQIDDDGYFESYTFTNNRNIDWFLNKDSFGIHFPFACHVTEGDNFEEKTCASHLWCGEDICWIYCSKVSGADLHLTVNMTEGSISDYTISRDRARESTGANYRGDFVLNPAPKAVLPNENITYTFRFDFAKGNPIDALKENSGFIHLSADKYTATPGEKICFSAYCRDGLKDLRVEYNGESISAENDGTIARWEAAFDEIGEKKFSACANGKKTYILVNVIEDVETILKKRAKFIARKQQYNACGSRLDGAYLCYDKDTDSMYYSNFWPDHNAGRERMAMGITVLKQLQREYDEELFASITKHREFIERELFDKETCMVYNEIGRDNSWQRMYNFPWFSVYFYEWYILTKEKRFLEYSAKILLNYCKLDTNDAASQCFEAYRIITELKKQGFTELADKLECEYLIIVEKMYRFYFSVKSDETGWVSESSNGKATHLLQGYMLSGKKKYLEQAKIYVASSRNLYGLQPDYHLNMVCVRHWDRYWFGRNAQYGDVFPHYWSVLAAEMFYWYEKATGIDCRKEIDTIIGANLCVYQPDGFAANNYLYPYKVNVFTSDGSDVPYAGIGTFYGKCFDERANDQDWVLYYAEVLK